MVKLPNGTRVPFLDCVATYQGRTADDEPPAESVREAYFAESLAESDGGATLGVIEAPAAMREKGTLCLIDFVPIEPGWGNKKDNHHYALDMLRREAPKFVGAKMYATNHVEEEKNVRNEVSQVIECPVRFTETGAPVARAAVYDRDFEYSIRQRNKAQRLEDLHCSIFADGLVKEGFELDGRTGKDVTAITEVKSVDWVARAGAGGRALSLVEAAQSVPIKQGAEEMAENEVKEEPTPVVEKEEGVKPEKIAETEEPVMTTAVVLKALIGANLPVPVALRLAEREYANEAALAEAIETATIEVTAILESAKPKAQPASKAFGLQESAKPEETGTNEERVREVLTRYNVVRSK